MAYPGPPSLTLLIRHTGQRIPLTQDVLTIGRQAGNTVVLSDAQVSRQHATIFWQAGAHVIQDLGSANGTYVNGRPITGPHPLSPGYVIQVGSTVIDVQGAPAMRDTLVGAAVPPAYQPAAAPSKRSLSPIIIGLLLAGIVLVGGILVAILLLGLRDDEPTVTIESPLPGAQVVAGTGIVLQATASGAEDIIQLELSLDGQRVATTTSPRPDGVSMLTVSQPLSFDSAAAHVVSAVAYTAQGKTSQATSISFAVVDSVGLATPTGTPSPPAAESPSPTTEATTAAPPASPTPTLPPPTTAAPDTPEPTSTPTDTPTPTPTGTPSPTHTPTPTPTPTETPGPIVEFWADTTSLAPGDSTFLHWHVENVLEVYLDGAPVTGPDGQAEVSPPATTTYELRAVHAGGEEIKQVTITVLSVPQTWSHPVRVLDNRRVYYLRLTEAGEIRVRAEWTGAQADLALIINGPGKTGYYARQDGTSPLEVAYTVTPGDLAAGDTWRLSIASFGTDRADGTVQITYPSGSGSVPFTDDFAVGPGFGSAVNVIVLRGAGAIGAQATWAGLPPDLALIVNGPGKVGYYARQDGSSPLSVNYSVTPADFANGDSWRVSLTAFSAPDVEGSIELRYP